MKLHPIAVVGSIFLTSLFASTSPATEPAPPPIPREFRAAWVATVANIDWPSKRQLSTEQQKQELVAILDRARELGLNAIILQVRPACDALYKSELEPWSPYLTGQMGQAPDSAYDPLEFAVAEAHRRGLELHVWINPYRALHPSYSGTVSDDHVSKRHPDWVREYGNHWWLDPGVPEALDHTIAVVLDIVNRYDIDGVHMDDYFYPYPVSADGQEVPFPDDESYAAAVAADPNTPAERGDWRRENVNKLVERLHRDIRKAKPWVKFGISPFGIWRPGNPPSIQGFDQYAKLYADARKWLNEGWVDYFTPQLYWPIDQKPQSYPVLLKWWSGENTQGRHLWPGNYTSRVAGLDGRAWPAEEIVRQIEITREQVKEPGNVHFSMKALMRDPDGLATRLREDVYAEPALIPATPWMATKTPRIGFLGMKVRYEKDRIVYVLESFDTPPWLWTLQEYDGKVWKTRILPGAETEIVASPESTLAEASMVDRFGRRGEPVRTKIQRP